MKVAPLALLRGRLNVWHDRRCRFLRWSKNEIGADAAPASQPLPLLDVFEIVDDRAHLVGLEDEFRHVRMTGKNAFRQGLAKTFDFVLAGEGAKWRCLRVGTGAAAADRMAAGTVGHQQRLTAPPGRATLFAPPRPCDAGGEQAEEQPAEHF